MFKFLRTGAFKLFLNTATRVTGGAPLCTALPRSRARDWLCKIRSTKLEFRKIAKFRVFGRFFRFKFLRTRAFKLFFNTATRLTGGAPLCTALPRSRARDWLCKNRSTKLEFRKIAKFRVFGRFFGALAPNPPRQSQPPGPMLGLGALTCYTDIGRENRPGPEIGRKKVRAPAGVPLFSIYK